MANPCKKVVKYWLMLVMVLLSACGNSDENAYQPELGRASAPQENEYVVGIHPLHNPQRLMEVYGPLVDYMNQAIPGAHFKLEASRNYEEFEKKLYAGHFAFAMPNPYQTVQSVKYGYRIFGKMGDDDMFRGIILVRRDGNIHNVSDLKGHAVSYPAATALAATMMPQYYLQTHGIDVNRDIENRYVGSQESSIMNVFQGYVAAGATWPVPWKLFVLEHPEMARELQVQWQTDSLPNNGWVVRADIPAPIAGQFAHLLFGMSQNEQGRAILERMPISCFEPASEATYRPILTFMDKFSNLVRHVDH